MDCNYKVEFKSSRPELSGFQEYYEQTMLPALLEMEDQRMEANRQAMKNGAIALIPLALGIAAFFALGYSVREDAFLFFAAIAIYILVAAFYAARPMRSVASNIHSFLMQKVCSFLKVEYDPWADDFPFALFKDAGLLPKHDNKSVKKHLYGRYKDTTFDLADCYLSKEVSDGSDTTRSKTVFNGVLIAIAYPERISGKTLLSADSGIFKNFFKGLFGNKKITLGHSNLDDRYLIYTTDEDEARKLLSPRRVEKIIALTEHIGPEALEIAFMDDYLMLAVKKDDENYSANLAQSPATCTRIVGLIVEEICAVFDLIDILELDEKPV